MLNQDQIRAHQAAVQTSLFTATVGSTQKYSGFQSSVSSHPVMRNTGPTTIRQMAPSMMASTRGTPAPFVGVPKSSWIGASTPMVSQRMSMTKQPYMMLTGQNQGNFVPSSIKFSAAVPPSSAPMSSLQGPA